MHIGKKVLAIGLTAVCLMAARPAHAAALLPGGSVAVAPVGVSGLDPFAGVHGAALATNFGPWAIQSGPAFATFWAAVYRDSGTGFLDFYYQVRSDSAAGTDAFNRETVNPYDSFGILDVVQTIGNFGVFQTGAQQTDSADRSANGNTVGFNFGAQGNGTLDPGEISYVVIVRTNARDFGTGNVQVIDGGVASRSTLVPVTVPEPASILLLGGGLTAAAARLRRRKKTA